MQEKTWNKGGALLRVMAVCVGLIAASACVEEDLSDGGGSETDDSADAGADGTDGGPVDMGSDSADAGADGTDSGPHPFEEGGVLDDHCGNGVVEDDEECDTYGFNGSCAPLGQWGGYSTCDPQTCKINFSGCDPSCTEGEPGCYCRIVCNDEGYVCADILPNHPPLCIPQPNC
jgi:hypothetical protein